MHFLQGSLEGDHKGFIPSALVPPTQADGDLTAEGLHMAVWGPNSQAGE